MRIVPAFLRCMSVLLIGLPFAGAVRAAPLLPYRVVAEYPHDTSAFTEGLTFDGQGRLIESTGRYAQSALLVRDLATGRALQRVALDSREFGEGAAVVGSRIVQLTWLNQVGHVYEAASLHALARFTLEDEGWGLTYDGRRLIRSNGTDRLNFLDPDTFKPAGSVQVRDGAAAVGQLNELEYAKGLVYANVWETDRVAVIVPDSGRVAAWLDLHGLRARFVSLPGWSGDEGVLNGIAYDPRSGHLFVTGKCWPKLFEIAVEPLPH